MILKENYSLKYREVNLPTKLDPFAVFTRILPYCENAFLLESLGPYSDFSRYTYIGFNPTFHITADNNMLTINGDKHKTFSPYDRLKMEFTNQKSQSLKKDGYCGGLVGYFPHEATRYFEPAFEGSCHPDYPDFEFGLYFDGLKYDRKTGQFVYFYLNKDRSQNIIDFISKPTDQKSFYYKFLGKNKTKNQYRKMFQQAKDNIVAGNIYQVVISIKHHYRLLGDPLTVYQQLRQINPSPHMYYLKFGYRHIIGASPELLIRLKGNHLEHFGTLAGTITRGKTEEEDQKLAKILKQDEKEKAEHMMLVDLARNDVGKICRFGKVKVKKMLTVKKYSHVQHLYSEISGDLKRDEDAFTALATCFPAGTLTGTPKIEAMKIISRLEEDPRGPYGGVVGYFSFSGDCMFAISIRSLYVAGKMAYTQIGSGIVYDSQFEKENQEIMAKHQSMRLALEKAKL